MERLNHQAELLLKKVTEESDKHTVQDPLSELKLMWDSLEEKIINRQVNILEDGGFIHDFEKSFSLCIMLVLIYTVIHFILEITEPYIIEFEFCNLLSCFCGF